MIELRIVTKMKFKSIADFDAFTRDERVHGITGFPKELQKAYATGRPVVVTTIDPPFGEITESYIEVRAMEKEENYL